MNKTFVFKRNKSEDVWRTPQATNATPSSRRKSLPRERALNPGRALSSTVYTSEFPLHNSLSGVQEKRQSSYSPSRRTPSASPTQKRKVSRNRDLKRKFCFNLHDEINKPIHTTELEEISDIDVITHICYTTLQAMMENKHQRKFLHHMNTTHNNNGNNIYLDKTSNSSNRMEKSKQIKESLSTMRDDIKRQLDHTTSPVEPHTGHVSTAPSRQSHLVTETKTATRRGSFMSQKSKTTISSNELPSTSTSIKDKKPGLKGVTAGKLRFNEDVAKFLKNLDEQAKSAAAERPGGPQVMNRHTLTPLEALYCPWLRLSKDQVEVLEQLCRDDGVDPGIHAHYDVNKVDVFDEIRKIRNEQKKAKDPRP